MPNQQTVLVVAPDSDSRASKCVELAAEGFAVRATNCTDEAWRSGAYLLEWPTQTETQ